MATAVARDRFYVARWTAAGALFGAFFVVIGWWVGTVETGGITFEELHRQMPVMWIVDLAPTVLGFVGLFVGVLHMRIERERSRTQRLAEEIAATWTADLQRANGELAEALDERERFYSAMSHELRTPLTSILGYSELAEGMEIAPNEASEYIHEIYRASSFLLQMVNELLEVAKLSQTGLTVALEDVSCCDVARNVVSLLKPLADSSGMSLHVVGSPDLGCRADPVRLRQTLTNLIANAIKYSDDGAVVVRSTGLGDRIAIEVIDQGPGIPADRLESIFLPFSQVDDRARTDSTGLGLVVCKALVEAMDGSIAAYSDGPGCGSTFRIELPAATGMPREVRTARIASMAAG